MNAKESLSYRDLYIKEIQFRYDVLKEFEPYREWLQHPNISIGGNLYEDMGEIFKENSKPIGELYDQYFTGNFNVWEYVEDLKTKADFAFDNLTSDFETVKKDLLERQERKYKFWQGSEKKANEEIIQYNKGRLQQMSRLFPIYREKKENINTVWNAIDKLRQKLGGYTDILKANQMPGIYDVYREFDKTRLKEIGESFNLNNVRESYVVEMISRDFQKFENPNKENKKEVLEFSKDKPFDKVVETYSKPISERMDRKYDKYPVQFEVFHKNVVKQCLTDLKGTNFTDNDLYSKCCEKVIHDFSSDLTRLKNYLSHNDEHLKQMKVTENEKTILNHFFDTMDGFESEIFGYKAMDELSYFTLVTENDDVIAGLYILDTHTDLLKRLSEKCDIWVEPIKEFDMKLYEDMQEKINTIER